MEQLAAADVVIVNTCSVTEEADREARAFIRRAHRRNPAARIVVTGCYAQRAPEEVAALPGVAAVVGNSHKALAPEIVQQVSGSAGQRVSESAGQALVDVRALMAGERVPGRRRCGWTTGLRTRFWRRRRLCPERRRGRTSRSRRDAATGAPSA